MNFQVVLALALSAGPATEPSLCVGFESKIEPDMQIRESDIDRAAASSAAAQLQGMISRGELSGEFKFGVLNQLKIVQGHVLLKQAQSDRTEFGADSPEAGESTAALCRWLSSEGFWYD
jgi:hypothetical protein